MVSLATKILVSCLFLAVVLWWVSLSFTDDTSIRLAILALVGVVLPAALIDRYDDR